MANKPKLGALNIVGVVILIIGALATAATIGQMVMGVGGDAAHLIVGGVIVVIGLVLATRKKSQ